MKMSLLPCLLSRHSQEMYHVYQSMHKNTSIFLYPSSYHLSIYLWEIYLLTKLQHLCTLLFVLRLPVKILFSKVNKVISFIMVMVLIFNLVQFIFLVYLFCFCSPSNLVGFNCLFIWGRGESDETHYCGSKRQSYTKYRSQEMSLPPHHCYPDPISPSFHPLSYSF